jgi:predicted oxidoreductase
MAWSPLGGGNLMIDDREWFEKASKYNATYAQLSLAWLLKHPAIFPVIGTTKPDRITEAVKSVAIDLDRQDWYEMLQWVRGEEVP